MCPLIIGRQGHCCVWKNCYRLECLFSFKLVMMIRSKTIVNGKTLKELLFFWQTKLRRSGRKTMIYWKVQVERKEEGDEGHREEKIFPGLPCFFVNQGAFLLLAGFWHGQTKRSEQWLIEDKISIHSLNDPLQSLLFLITFLLTIILTERQVRCSWNEKCIDELILKLHWALIDLKSKSLRCIFVFV